MPEPQPNPHVDLNNARNLIRRGAEIGPPGDRFNLNQREPDHLETSGLGPILRERARQVWAEGYSYEHDDKHRNGELAQAACCYAHIACMIAGGADFGEVLRERYLNYHTSFPLWPWEEEWWKPTADPARNLAKSGALAAAEIARLQRALATDAKAATEEKCENCPSPATTHDTEGVPLCEVCSKLP